MIGAQSKAAANIRFAAMLARGITIGICTTNR